MLNAFDKLSEGANTYSEKGDFDETNSAMTSPKS